MRYATVLLAFILSLAASAWAQDQAVTGRATDLRERNATDGRSLASLPENTPVKVISRAGAWTKVETGGKSGWVNAFHLRFPVAVEKSSSGGGLAAVTSMFGGGSRSNQPTIATTGIRGLSPEDLKNSKPDAAAFQKAQTYRADKPAAERFAREGKLASVNVEDGGRR